MKKFTLLFIVIVICLLLLPTGAGATPPSATPFDGFWIGPNDWTMHVQINALMEDNPSDDWKPGWWMIVINIPSFSWCDGAGAHVDGWATLSDSEPNLMLSIFGGTCRGPGGRTFGGSMSWTYDPDTDTLTNNLGFTYWRHHGG